MPKFQNMFNRSITVFANNAIPITFKAGEVKELSEEVGSNYKVYLRKVKPITEEVKKEDSVRPGRRVIGEIKQPAPNKELVKEPVLEEAKKGSKLQEGYSPAFMGEQTIGSVSPMKGGNKN